MSSNQSKKNVQEYEKRFQPNIYENLNLLWQEKKSVNAGPNTIILIRVFVNVVAPQRSIFTVFSLKLFKVWLLGHVWFISPPVDTASSCN